MFNFLREKQSTASRSEFGFISKGAIGKTGVPKKVTFRGDSTVGLSYKDGVL